MSKKKNIDKANKAAQSPSANDDCDDQTPTLLKYADFNYGEFLKRRNVRILVIFVVVVAALAFGFWLSSIFVPLLVALMFAYILNPLVVWLENKGLSRLKAVLAIFAGFFATSGLALVLVVPGVLSNVGEFARDAHTYPEKIETKLQSAVQSYNESAPEGARIDEDAISWDYIRSTLESQFKGMSVEDVTESDEAEQVAMSALDLAKSIFGTFLTWVLFLTLVPLYTFYFMMGLDRIWGGIREHLPGRQRDQILKVLNEIHVMVSAFFRGRLTICLIVATMTTAVYLAFGVPFAVVLGLTGGFGVIIPFFSIVASLIPALLIMLVGNDYSTATIIAVTASFLVIQALEQYWLTPKILGKAVELHPVTLLVGVFVMAELFGFFGALLAVPLTAIAKIIGRELILPYFKALAAEPASTKVQEEQGAKT